MGFTSSNSRADCKAHGDIGQTQEHCHPRAPNTALSAWAGTTALPLQKLLLFPGKESFPENTQVLNKAAPSEQEIKEALKYLCQHQTEQNTHLASDKQQSICLETPAPPSAMISPLIAVTCSEATQRNGFYYHYY